jgi:hypothetical protein
MRRLLIASIAFLIISSSARAPFCQEAEGLSGIELKIFREFKGRVETVRGTIPPLKYGAKLTNIKHKLARKYDVTLDKLDEIVAEGYQDNLWQIYKYW